MIKKSVLDLFLSMSCFWLLSLEDGTLGLQKWFNILLIDVQVRLPASDPVHFVSGWSHWP